MPNLTPEQKTLNVMPPKERAIISLEMDIVEECKGLNFCAISNILEGYGYDDPEDTLGKLKKLHESMLLLHSLRRAL